MAMLVSSRASSLKCETNTVNLELVIGQHNSSKNDNVIAFTKWCPPEDGVTSCENAKKAVDLALSRLGQTQVALMQCINHYHTLSAEMS